MGDNYNQTPVNQQANYSQIQNRKGGKNKGIIITAIAVIIAICIAAAVIVIPKISEEKNLNDYLINNTFLHFAVVQEKIIDCYADSGDEEQCVSDGIKSYYDESSHIQDFEECSEIEFDSKYGIVTHAVFIREITDEIILNTGLSDKYKGGIYRITVDVPSDKYEMGTNISAKDMNIDIEKIN